MGFFNSKLKRKEVSSEVVPFTSEDVKSEKVKAGYVPAKEASSLSYGDNLFLHSPLTLSYEEAELVVKKCWAQIQGQTKQLEDGSERRGGNVSGGGSVRLFVSSTFADFHSEREILMKQVFPEVREICQKHGLSFIEVDLRWGVPSESSSFQTISACLEEIDRCYSECSIPFFLGLLGSRYGWIPGKDDVGEILENKYNWVPNVSITHMEILHGALRRHRPNALFFLRNPGGLETIPSEQREKFADQDNLSQLQLLELRKQVELHFQIGCYPYDASFQGFDKNSSKEKLISSRYYHDPFYAVGDVSRHLQKRLHRLFPSVNSFTWLYLRRHKEASPAA